MSSFFTVSGAQKKRKRTAAPEPPKKRVATSKTGGISRGKAASRPATNGSGNAGTGRAKAKAPSASKWREERDSSISGSDSEDDDDSAGYGHDDANVSEDSGSDGSDHEGETAAERRLRLAERYLDNVREEVQVVEGFDAEQIDRDLIAERLQEDVAESKGKVYRKLAAELDFESATHTLFRTNNDNVITSVATCPPYAYTTSKDMYLVKWRLQDLPQYQFPQTTKKKPKKPPAPPRRQPDRVRFTKGDKKKEKSKSYKGHTGEILAVTASQDGKYVVTAGADGRMVVHDAKTLRPLRAFTQHRDAVTGVAFRRGSNQLYSCSKDRTVKVWSIDELAYVETLFGHQDHVVDIDTLAQERCISVGARDRTARLWKVVEETQLVFRGGGAGDRKGSKPDVPSGSAAHEGSMDRVAMIDEELFVTGSDNGSLGLWSTTKKKPLHVVPRAHGLDPPMDPTMASGEKHPDPAKVVPSPQPRWITALRTIPYSDIILSGSWDGYVRVWRLSDDKKKIEPLGILGAPSEASSNPSAATANGHLPTNGVNGTSPDSEDGEEKENDDDTKQEKGKPAAEDNSEQITTQKKNGSGNNNNQWRIKGIVNDISTFERGDRGRDGLCVVIAVGREHRLGRWKTVKGGRNGAMVFEVPRAPRARIGQSEVNGEGHDKDI